MEIWKDITDYEGYYKISDYGRVMSIKNNLIMKPETMKLGYLRIQLSKNGRTKKLLIHVLVANAFLIKKHSGLEVNHIDEIKSNNYASNLEWVTHSENMMKGTVQIRKSNSNNKNTEKQRKTVFQYSKDKTLIKKWSSINSLKNEGYSICNVSQFCNGIYASQLYRGCIWAFNELN